MRRNRDVAAEMRGIVATRLRRAPPPLAMRYKQLERIAALLGRAPDIDSLHSRDLIVVEWCASQRYKTAP
jgi:hypothetical protein